MELMWSCPFLKGGLTLWPNNIMTPCCLGMYGDFEGSALVMSSCPDSFDAQAWQGLRDATHENLAKGVRPPECQGCPMLQQMPKEHSNNNFFTAINIINSRKCNISCNFCYLSKEFRSVDCSFDPHIGLFQDIVFKGLVNEETTIFWGGGEPALHPHLQELYFLFKSARCRQHFDTNSTVYMNFLESDLSIGNTSVSCSLMTPDHKTYHTMMGRDLCDQAWQNASRYAATGGDVRAKFVMLPENNGQEEEFLYKCKNIGITIANLDCEIYGVRGRTMPHSLINRAAMFIHYASAQGIDLLHGVGITMLGDSFLQQVYSQKSNIEENLIQSNDTKFAKISLFLKGRSSSALSSQVFFLGVISDIKPVTDMTHINNTLDLNWKTGDYSYFKNEKYCFTDKINCPISFFAHYDKTLRLKFISHMWSGIISICINGRTLADIDLYSETTHSTEVDILSGDVFKYRRIF